MSDSYFGSHNIPLFERQMDRLIGLFNEVELGFNINEIQSRRVAAAQELPEVHADMISAELTGSRFECPIYTEEDTPLLLLGPGEPILLDVDKKIVEEVLNCPLKLLTYPALVHAVKARLQHSVGLHYVLKALEKTPD
jgi:hypothetical protein